MTRPSSLALLLLAVLLTACPRSTPVDSGSTPPPRPDLDSLREVLGPSDVIEVRVHEEESLSGTFRVDTDGTIVYPLLGQLKIAGATANEVAETVRAGLEGDYLVAPQVSVFVSEYNSRKVAVIGEVNNPGRYPFREGLTLIDALAEAGGTTEHALLNSVRVTRATSGEEERSFDLPFKDIAQGLAPDFLLVPGDIIYVAESPVR
jgi:protein involved in polysaccharide export with SLBB domain